MIGGFRISNFDFRSISGGAAGFVRIAQRVFAFGHGVPPAIGGGLIDMVLAQRDKFFRRLHHLVGPELAPDKEIRLGRIAGDGHADARRTLGFAR